MASNIEVLGLMLILFISGIAMAINLPGMMGINLGLGFGDMTNPITTISILLVKLVGVILVGLSAFVSWNIIKG